MTNVKVERKGNVVTLTVDLSRKGAPSASGKTLVVASTNGNAAIEGDGGWVFGLNVFTKQGVGK